MQYDCDCDITLHVVLPQEFSDNDDLPHIAGPVMLIAPRGARVFAKECRGEMHISSQH